MTVTFNAYAQPATKTPDRPTAGKPGIAEGTIILTQSGARCVETIRPDDKIVTRDHGLQPVRWVGTSLLHAGSDGAPVHFAAGAMGPHDALTLAPNTRVLIRNPLAKALFGEAEVFAYAADLVNGTTIRVLNDTAPLRVVHLLLDHHEILRAAEMEVESLHPDRALMRQLDLATQNAILRLLPNCDALMGYGYGPTARICLRRSEARILCANR